MRGHAKAPSTGLASGRDVRNPIGLVCLCALSIAAFLGASAPAAVAACANEDIRLSAASNTSPATGQPYSAGLPECRAYELVTPPYKQFQFAKFNVGYMAPISPNANAIGWTSLGLFGDAESSNNGSNYVSTRTASGWTTASTNAPFSVIGATALAQVILPSADQLGGATCGLLTPSTHLGELERTRPFACALRAADGSWTATPPFKTYNNLENVDNINDLLLPIGSSSDLSHLVIFPFGGQRFLAADTATADTGSLYEIAGLGGLSPQLRLVNVDSGGVLIGPATKPELGSAASKYQAVSADGSTIYFTATPAGGVSTLYARLDGATTTAISNPSPAECTTCSPAVKAGSFTGASADGSKAFFTTAQQLLDVDTDSTPDLYEYDFDAAASHHIVQASGGGTGDPTPGTGADVQGVVQSSRDGSHVYFFAKGLLTSEPNGLGQSAVAGAFNLYVFERDAVFPAGRTRFLTTLPAGEAGLLAGGEEAIKKYSPSQVTPDGRYLIFRTATALGADDLDSADDIYRYDSQTGALIRISIGEPGYPASNNGNTAGMNAVIEGPAHLLRSSPVSEGEAISADGSYVIFATPERLQADDETQQAASSACEAFAATFAASTTGCDVYLWHEGTVRMVSPGQQEGGSQAGSVGGRLSQSGSEVAFLSSAEVVPQDTDELADIYAARIDGGFPYTPPPSPCAENEACHGAPPQPPAASAPGSASVTGPGNEATPKPKHPRKHHKGKKHHHNGRAPR